MINLLKNPSFEEGWEDLSGTCQEPNGWALTWAQPGNPMQSAGAFHDDDPPVIDTVLATPECVHKLAWLDAQTVSGGDYAGATYMEMLNKVRTQ